jgi:hypothetical protein
MEEPADAVPEGAEPTRVDLEANSNIWRPAR